MQPPQSDGHRPARRFRNEKRRVRRASRGRSTDLRQSIDGLAATVTATRGLELSAEDRVALDELIAALAQLLSV
jgi:hypothetical protein